ncbi:hypothetical protein L596_016453 [Steinernema carpocapsae]|uniref:Uncharacterized protein n=1 Tax=Steinernema carpocapsae TaxID=34508 RepID=A0A4U5NIX0_STECR|nr:hypothetical protein L596_016453 [Steinernema carpocapsae]
MSHTPARAGSRKPARHPSLVPTDGRKIAKLAAASEGGRLCKCDDARERRSNVLESSSLKNVALGQASDSNFCNLNLVLMRSATVIAE